MPTLAEMRVQVKAEGGIDAPDATVDGWLNDRYRRLVTASKWRQSKVELGPTAAAQSTYEKPADVVDITTIWVDSAKYIPASVEEMVELQQNRAHLIDADGAFGDEYGPDGEELVELFPTPDTNDLTIIALAAVAPPVLEADEPPVVPDEFMHFIVEGAIADGLGRMDERLAEAADWEVKFQTGVELLEQRRNSLIGSGPIPIRMPTY